MADTGHKSSTPTHAALSGDVSAVDPVLHEKLVAPWQLSDTPLQRGEFGYRMRFLRLPGITLYRESFDLRCRLLGHSPAGTLVFAIPLTHHSHSSYWGQQLDSPGVLATAPGGLDVTLAGGHAQLVLLVESDLMASQLPADVSERFQNAIDKRYLQACPEDVVRLGDWLCALIDTPLRNPGILGRPALLRSIATSILLRLAKVIHLPECPSGRVRTPSRRRTINRALSYLETAELSSLTIPKVARATCVSVRTLEYAFRETFDQTPLAFVRRRRLQAARRDLWRADPTRTTVTRVALRHGFHHPSRFAAYYRRSFGESPSATLSRAGAESAWETAPLTPDASASHSSREQP